MSLIMPINRCRNVIKRGDHVTLFKPGQSYSLYGVVGEIWSDYFSIWHNDSNYLGRKAFCPPLIQGFLFAHRIEFDSSSSIEIFDNIVSSSSTASCSNSARSGNNKEETKKMTTKTYRLKKDAATLLKGAILEKGSDDVYRAIDDIWNVEGNEVFNKRTLSGIGYFSEIVENCPEWFERVYKVSSLKGMCYVVKDKMREILSSKVVPEDTESEE